jgi:hypothetical protein
MLRMVEFVSLDAPLELPEDVAQLRVVLVGCRKGETSVAAAGLVAA